MLTMVDSSHRIIAYHGENGDGFKLIYNVAWRNQVQTIIGSK